MADASITVDKKDMRKVDLMLKRFPRKAPMVLQRAINKTSDAARVQSVRAIARNTGLKQKDLFQKGNRRRPLIQSRATNTNLESIIETSKRRIPLSRFKPKQVYSRQTKAEKESGAKRKKAGVSYDLGKGRKTIKDAFIGEVKGGRAVTDITRGTGHIGVFIRKRESRFPIQELFGPSILHVFAGSTNILKNAIKRAEEKLPKEIDNQLNLVLEKQKMKGAG